MSTSLDKKQNNLLINKLKPSVSLALRQGGGYKPCYSCTLAIWLGINEGVNIGVNIFVWFCDYCLVVLNLFQHLTSLEGLLVLNKILNSLKITDKSPYFLCFQNDTKIIFDFNSSPNEERICGWTTQLVANSDIPPQRGRLGGVQHGWCKNSSRQTGSFNTILDVGLKKVRCKSYPRQTSSFKTSMEGGYKKC